MEMSRPLDLGEAARLAALRDLEILDSGADGELDRVTRLVALSLEADGAAVSLVDAERQWFKSRYCIPLEETPREIAFCDHTIAARETIVVLDATEEERFSSNPLVCEQPGIRFYAGAPLFTSAGHCLGSLCVIDGQPRKKFDERQITILEGFAAFVAEYIEARRNRQVGAMMAKVVDATPDAVVAADRDGKIVHWNPAAEAIFGYPRDDALGQDVSLIIPKPLQADHMANIERLMRSEPIRLPGNVAEMEALHAEGHTIPVELSLTNWGSDGWAEGFAAVVRDISDRRLFEEEGRRAQQLLDTVVFNLPVMIFVKDAETLRYLLVNPKAQELVGLDAQDMIGKRDGELFADNGKRFEARDRAALQTGKPIVFESKFTRPDGVKIDLRTTRVLVDGPDRANQYILGISEDTTRLRKVEAATYHLARYDALTGCLNRASYFDRLQDLVTSAHPFAMLSIDLDRFKAVNDQFGHVIGDNVLQEISERLCNTAANEDTEVARIGGDEFAILLTGSNLRIRAEKLANVVIDQVTRPVKAGRASAHVGASIGVVFYPDDGPTVEELREHADLALYRAKNQGRGTTCFFDNSMDSALRDRQKLEADLRKAIEEGQIALHYQPVVCARTGKMTSVEALARWHHDRRGAVPPDLFISVAEDCGLIEELGEKLLHRACMETVQWRSDLRVAVNLSPVQFRSGSLVENVEAALRESGLRPDRLLLEVTERLVIQNPDEAFDQLEELRRLGIQILMDDFGVGHSSLSYFQRFPFDKVKIDKTFIAELERSPTARAIVRAVVGLGKELSMGIVAEGIETQSQVRLLSELGCTHLQGYLFSRPLAPQAVNEFDLKPRTSCFPRDPA